MRQNKITSLGYNGLGMFIVTSILLESEGYLQCIELYIINMKIVKVMRRKEIKNYKNFYY